MNEAPIRKYLMLALSRLKRDLTAEEEREMAKIREQLGMSDDEIIAAGKSLIVP